METNIVYIVRHGQTEENVQRILQGHLPGKLTPQGVEQIQDTAERLKNLGVDFKRIVSSDLERAYQSARILSETLNLEISKEALFRERDWGTITGMPISEARDKFRRNGVWEFPETVETEGMIMQRAQKAIQLLKEKYADGPLVVVTHGLMARNLIAAVLGCEFREVQSFINGEFRKITLK